MSVTEFQRHQVFQWLEEAMGTERAAIMMDLLPPVGWGDVVTTADLALTRSEIQSELHKVRSEMHEMRGDIIRTVVFSVLAGNATLVGLVLAAVQLG